MTNKTKALVIGGSGRLGSEVCRVLSRKGFDLVFTYHLGSAKAQALARELIDQGRPARALALDLANIDQVRKVIGEANETMGGLDALVVTSGLATAHDNGGRPSLPEYREITPDIFDRMIRVNVRGVFFACREAAMIMSGKGGGRIVITGSIDGMKIAHPPVDYVCCKAALWGITRALAKELGEEGVLVNMVAPGILEGGVANLLTDKMMEEYLKHCSLKRVGTFSEIANVIAFLAGSGNTYITGQAVILDGGL